MFYPKAEQNQKVGPRKVVDQGEIVVISSHASCVCGEA